MLVIIPFTTATYLLVVQTCLYYGRLILSMILLEILNIPHQNHIYFTDGIFFMFNYLLKMAKHYWIQHKHCDAYNIYNSISDFISDGKIGSGNWNYQSANMQFAGSMHENMSIRWTEQTWTYVGICFFTSIRTYCLLVFILSKTNKKKMQYPYYWI